MKWHDIGDGGLRAEYDQGDFDGAIVTTAEVVQGGNGLWTPWVFQIARGRRKKSNTLERVKGKCVSVYYPGQVKTREEAITLCEQHWMRLLTTPPNNRTEER